MCHLAGKSEAKFYKKKPSKIEEIALFPANMFLNLLNFNRIPALSNIIFSNISPTNNFLEKTERRI